ncbi:hypothetical protein MMARJ_20640 [Mycobacterium marseillense]|uniref:Uncharacterized protein n=1 Tax=Mycobacterium marseillense TaxID=701042 RepID=A0ABN5ZS88_9MYCO|nr:hypothetical protein MMARJ_20640 [Mycobacterium marseillense]
MSINIASTTLSRVRAENTGASLVLAAASLLTAMINATSPTVPAPPGAPSARMPLMGCHPASGAAGAGVMAPGARGETLARVTPGPSLI